MRCSCDEAGVEVGCDRNSKLGFRSLDATKQAWRFDAIEIRSLDSEAWTLGGCDEASVEVCLWFDADEVGSFKLDSEAWMLC